jgi:hypothetical protein
MQAMTAIVSEGLRIAQDHLDRDWGVAKKETTRAKLDGFENCGH